MMPWKKQVFYSSRYNFLVFLLTPALIITAMISQEGFLFSLSLLFILFISVNKFYLSYVVKKLSIQEEVTTLRLFPEEEATFKIPLENHGKIPVYHAKLELLVYDSDEAIQVKDVEGLEKNKTIYISHLSIPASKKRPFTLDFTAVKRGIVQIRSIKLVIHDLFGFNKVHLQYDGKYRSSAIVYPAPKSITGLEKITRQEKGSQSMPFSMYEDVMMTRGNRDYSSADPFNRINWKASARKDSLQTKVYEKVTLSKWTIVVNVNNPNPLSVTIDNLEEVLSQVTYTCQYAVKHDISFEMYINIRIPGVSSGLYLPIGHGKEHLTKALEIFARIRKVALTVPITHVLYTMTHKAEQPDSIIHFGTYGDAEKTEYTKLVQHGARLHIVSAQETEMESIIDKNTVKEGAQ